MSKRKRFIQVGLGGWGAYWVGGVMPRLINELGLVEPAAVVDTNPDTFPRAIAAYSLPPEKCYTDARRAFDENPADFAIIVTPPAFHEDIVDLALQNDMDILSEKPIAETMDACCRIYKKVTAAGRKMAVTMSHRFDQDKQTLEREVKSGRYGAANYIVCRFTHNCREHGSWGEFRHRISDPLIVEGSVHHFDIIRALTGSNAKTVYAVTWNPAWGEYSGSSTALVTVEMENGVKAFYEGAKANASTMNPWTNEYFRVECCDGTLELDRRWLRVLKGGPWARPLQTDIPLLEQPVWMNPWLAELFVDWLNGGPAPRNTLEDNIQCAALTCAAVESSRTGSVIDVQEFLRRHMDSG